MLLYLWQLKAPFIFLFIYSGMKIWFKTNINVISCFSLLFLFQHLQWYCKWVLIHQVWFTVFISRDCCQCLVPALCLFSPCLGLPWAPPSPAVLTTSRGPRSVCGWTTWLLHKGFLEKQSPDQRKWQPDHKRCSSCLLGVGKGVFWDKIGIVAFTSKKQIFM